MPGLSPGALRCSEGEDMRNRPRRWRRHSGKGGITGVGGAGAGGCGVPEAKGRRCFREKRVISCV